MGTLWNCWVRFNKAEGGFVLHVCEEGSASDLEGRSICGVDVTEYGGIELGTPGFNEPSCRRCASILKRRGLLPAAQFAAAAE